MVQLFGPMVPLLAIGVLWIAGVVLATNGVLIVGIPLIVVATVAGIVAVWRSDDYSNY